MAALKLERQKLALGALILPILGMAGLFAWAGSVSSVSSISVVQSFISAYNTRNCTVMSHDLYRAPGSKATSCSQLVGPTDSSLQGCVETAIPSASLLSSGTHLPAGYSDAEGVRAACAKVTTTNGTTKRQSIAFNFITAENSAGAIQIVGISLA